MRFSDNETYSNQSKLRLNPDFIICLTKPHIISTINTILKEKEKAMGWEGGFTNETVWTCLYACYLYNNYFLCLFVCFLVFFL